MKHFKHAQYPKYPKISDLTKKESEVIHFTKRCKERLGVQINRKEIERKIRNQDFDTTLNFYAKQTNRVTLYEYKYENQYYIIPYDKNTHKVITIYPKDTFDINHKYNKNNYEINK